MFTRTRLATLILLLALASLALPGKAQAACTTPTANAGAIIYNSTDKLFQYCNDTNWKAMNAPGSGSGGCTSPTLAEGNLIYNADARVIQGCAGNVHKGLGTVGGGNKWVQLDSGDYHACGIKNNGTLWCWGGDTSSQLGNGATTGTQFSPVQESTTATDWAFVSASGNNTCAIKKTGSLWCWGSDGFGQLGNGALSSDQVSPVRESTNANNWLSVSLGNDHTCAIKTNGTLWCWGSDANGQLGNGATTGNQISPVQESTLATNWISISVGYQHSCAIKSTGTLWCWGFDGSGQLGNGAPSGNQVSPVQESTISTNWASVSSGFQHTCAIKTTGTLWCWGSDSSGQIGNGGTTGNQISPVQEISSSTNWSSVASGTENTCAIKSTGSLWCWGDDTAGQVGNGTITGIQNSPVQEASNKTDWILSSIGYYYTCALKTTGLILCWGDNNSGQLGDGGITLREVSPVQESSHATNWTSVSAGFFSHTCAVKGDGTLWCWGGDLNGQLGNGATTGDQISPVQESTAGTDWASVTAGQYHSCAIKTTGTLWCWGSDSRGQLGNGAPSGDQISPVQESTSANDWKYVSAGGEYTCAVKTTGTLWCWGSDSSGGLGNGVTSVDQESPVQESTIATNWANVSTGSEHTCAIKNNGTLWCWGPDYSGQLGNGAAGDQDSPTQESTAATDWIFVDVGDYEHTCALKNNRTLWCWGEDYDGELGNGVTTGRQDDPVQESTAATDWVSVSAGYYNSCAVKLNNTLWCWGYDANGQLGNGIDATSKISPVQISAGWAAVSAGREFTCAIGLFPASLYCWGLSGYGQMGSGKPIGDQALLSTTCSSPDNLYIKPGTMIYNSTLNVIQYCDGSDWVKVGW